MPNVTVYIRKEDYAKWSAIDDKPGLIHDVLDRLYTPVMVIEPAPMPTPQLNKPIITTKNKDMEFCKHGAVIGFCKKGCK